MFELSFAPEFFGDVHNPGVWAPGKPTTLAQSIMEQAKRDPSLFRKMTKDVFGYTVEVVTETVLTDIIDKVIEHNTCSFGTSGKDPYTDVYVDDYYSFRVYDAE